MGPPVATFRGSVATPAPHFNGGGIAPSSRFWGGVGYGTRRSYGNNGGYNGHSGHEEEGYREHHRGYSPGLYPGQVGLYPSQVVSGWVDLNYPGYGYPGYSYSGYPGYGYSGYPGYGYSGYGYPGYGAGYSGYPFLSGFEDPTPSTGYMNGTVYTNGAVDTYGAAGPPPDQTGAAYGYPPAYSYGQPSGYAAQPGPAPPAVAQAMPNAPAQGVRPGYQPQAATGTTTPTPAAEEQEEEPVTLVFKDKRPSEHIHNYVMTRTTLYVQDEHHREIPLGQLDLAATERVNHSAGISFEVPSGAR